jgi:hypothetical protein
MAWHIRRSTSLSSLSLPLVFALACTNGEVLDSGDIDAGGTASTTDATGTTTATSTTTPMTSSSATATSTAATETAATETATTETATTAVAESSTGPGEPFACTEELTCNAGEICVLPCCGGPAPACFPLPADGDCGTGYLDEGGVRCCQNDPDPVACMQMQWCVPGPCVADPPYCATADEVTCNGTDCTTEGCYGELVDGQLLCRCK